MPVSREISAFVDMKTEIFLCFLIATVARVMSNPVNLDEVIDADKEFTDKELKLDQVQLLSRFSDSQDDPNFDKYEKYQGDILLTPEQKESLEKPEIEGFLDTRTGLLDESFRWPKDNDGSVIVPFAISDDYSKC